MALSDFLPLEPDRGNARVREQLIRKSSSRKDYGGFYVVAFLNLRNCQLDRDNCLLGPYFRETTANLRIIIFADS